MEPHIMHVEKLWRDSQGEQWLYGCWFYRPNETFHLATRKFLEKVSEIYFVSIFCNKTVQ